MLSLGPLNKPLRFLRRFLPRRTFITLHYCYFIFTCLLFAVILWGSSTPTVTLRLSFIDALYLAVSAMTLAGLNPVNLSQLNTFQQFCLFLLIMLGSAIFVSAFVVNVRRRAFGRKFHDVLEKRRLAHPTTWGPRHSRSFRSRASNTHRDLKPENDHQPTDQLPAAIDASDEERKEYDLQPVSTPPERRGAPEMNGISSKTGEPLDADDDFDTAPAMSWQDATSPNGGTRPAITFREDTHFQHQTHQGPLPIPSRTSIETRGSSLQITPASKGDISKYFDSVGGWIARNSQFHGLSEKEREKLGGYEYRAVRFLDVLVPIYFVLWQLLGALGCAAWVANNRPVTALTNGLNPWWVGAFNAISAFNNSGMSLLDANMVAFQTSYYLLITMGLLILAGNTCYPIFLRLIVWTMWKISQSLPGQAWQERARTLRFLLDHPRRCYTNLFPSQHTWWLVLAVFVLNGIDWAAFEILNIDNSLLTQPTHIRVIDGLFQAFAVRSGGFYVVSIPTLRISLLVLYVIMMYINVYPVVITMRNSNVYEERSLGLYAEDVDGNDDDTSTINQERPPGQKPEFTTARSILRHVNTLRDHVVPAGTGSAHEKSQPHFVRQQLHAQLAHDAWWIALAIFLIMIIENGSFVADPALFSVFNFLFEIVSAYACVGISVGLPNEAYSFSGAWHTLSKLILCAVMLRGRHRGLPVAIDKAILLPGDQEGRAEEDDGKIRLARSVSRMRNEEV